MKRIIAALFVLLVICLIALPLFAQTPARVTVQSVAGAAEVELEGKINPLHSAFNIQAIIFRGAAVNTATVTFVTGGVTNAVDTKAITATDRTLAVTNVPWLFSGDKIRITNTSTNTHNVDIVWEER